MKIKHTLLLFFLAITIQNITAQKMTCIFQVANEIDCQPIDSVNISLSLEDDKHVSFQDKPYFNEAGYHFLVFDYAPGIYTITVRKDGYDDAKKQFKVSSVRQGVVNDIIIFMKKVREHNLNEVVVKATRIKMVMRGDTIVYDANAFNLANGSMLDALVERLPGTELHDGNITVNGKHIESLLINGEEFFSGNPQVALQNLPAYTVKNIKVYDKSQDDSYLKKGKTRLHNEPDNLVMDVMLKKNTTLDGLLTLKGATAYHTTAMLAKPSEWGIANDYALPPMVILTTFPIRKAEAVKEAGTVDGHKTASSKFVSAALIIYTKGED